MLSYSDGDFKVGIKDRDVDNEHEVYNNIEEIITSASDFLLSGAYNISVSNNNKIIQGLMNKKNIVKGIMLPIIKAYDRATINDVNKVLNTLVSNDIGVIINPDNHSKFILSEKSIYFGSANLTENGMKNNCEVISILKNTYGYYELFNELKSDFGKMFLKNINNKTVMGLDSRNKVIIDDINKVENVIKYVGSSGNTYSIIRNINNLEEYNNKINCAITDYFRILSIKDFSKIYVKLENIRKKSIELINYGNYLITEEDIMSKQRIPDKEIKKYNTKYLRFIDELDKIKNFIETEGNNLKSYELDRNAYKNRELNAKIECKIDSILIG